MSEDVHAPRTYGGRFFQTMEDKARCVEGVFCDKRRARFQCTRKRGKGPGGLYCGIHNPEARAEKQRLRDAAREAERRWQTDNSPLTIALRRAEKAEAEVKRLNEILSLLANSDDPHVRSSVLNFLEDRSALEAKP